MRIVPDKPASKFKYFFLLSLLVHVIIILSINLQPIATPPPPSKILVVLRQPIIPTSELISKKIATTSSVDTDAKITYLTKSLEQKFNAYAQRPRRRAISTSITEPNYSNYLEKWRHKVEVIGNQNYPELARRLGLQGNLILQVTVQKNGSIQQVQVVYSSGYKILDEAAMRIVQLAAPFEPFPESISKEVDVLDITRTWQFMNKNANDKTEAGSTFSMLNSTSKP